MEHESSFDGLFEGSCESLFWGLVSRLESPRGGGSQIQELSPHCEHLLRLAFLKTRFDNGGLLYVFECDGPGNGRNMCAALEMVGLREGAKILKAAFDLFPNQEAYDDWDSRFATIARVRPEFDRLDLELGQFVADIEEASCRYVRSHRQEYEFLRVRRSYDSIQRSYKDSGPDAG